MAATTTKATDERLYRQLVADYPKYFDVPGAVERACKMVALLQEAYPAESLEEVDERSRAVVLAVMDVQGIAAAEVAAGVIRKGGSQVKARRAFRTVLSGGRNRPSPQAVADKAVRTTRTGGRRRERRAPGRTRARAPSGDDGPEPPPLERVCRGCRRPFETDQPRRKYCDDRCKSRTLVAQHRARVGEMAALVELAVAAVREGGDPFSALVMVVDPPADPVAALALLRLHPEREIRPASLPVLAGA